MLEQQQSQLVAGVRQMYRKLLDGETWPGSALPEQQEGFPLTHDILERLDVLHMTGENPVGSEAFDDDLESVQQRLLDNGALYVPRRSSPSTDSEPELAHADSPRDNPIMSRSSVSSTASRKRSSPATPPPPQPEDLQIPTKRRNFHGIGGVQQSVEFFQEPFVMQSPEFSEPSIDFPLYNNYELTGRGFNVFDNLGLNMTGMPTLSPMAGLTVDSWAQDPDFDNFMRSGYHGPIA
jgi:hypothetical protein